jgi:hypothetical protein
LDWRSSDNDTYSPDERSKLIFMALIPFLVLRSTAPAKQCALVGGVLEDFLADPLIKPRIASRLSRTRGKSRCATGFSRRPSAACNESYTSRFRAATSRWNDALSFGVRCWVA